MEIERGMRQLQELGVEAAVDAALAEWGHTRRQQARLPSAALVGLRADASRDRGAPRGMRAGYDSS